MSNVDQVIANFKHILVKSTNCVLLRMFGVTKMCSVNLIVEFLTQHFSMSAQAIPDYPWKLFQITGLKLPEKLFLPSVGAWGATISFTRRVTPSFVCM